MEKARQKKDHKRPVVVPLSQRLIFLEKGSLHQVPSGNWWSFLAPQCNHLMTGCLLRSPFTKLNVLECSLSHCLARMAALRSRYFTPLLDCNLGDHSSVAVWIVTTTFSLCYSSDLPPVKWECCSLTIRCVVDKFHWSLPMCPHVTATGVPKLRDVAFKEATTGFNH